MLDVLTTQEFDEWLRKLRDRDARVRILARLDRLVHGNMGDVRPVGQGVIEMRFMFGPGYRVYLARHGSRVVLLLCGGDTSNQAADIVRARQLAQAWRAEREEETS